MVIAGTHDTTLVILSVIVAVVASYTALDLAGRVRVTVGAARFGWLTTAALAMGGGIWSMHFVAMLAFSMPGMEVSYEAGLTVLSLLVAIAATGVGFLIVAQAAKPRLPILLASGLVTGLGVATMHYMGMAAMRMQADLDYDRLWVVISIFIAVGAATIALYLSGRNSRLAERLVAALIMGVAVAGMHYAAMRGSVFRMQPGIEMTHSMASLGQSKLAIGIASSTFLILFLALIAAMFDRRYAETQTRLQGDLQTAYDRQSLMLRLGDRMRVLDDASTIMAETAEALGCFLRLERVGFYRVGKDGLLDFDHGACWVQGLQPLSGRRPAEAFGPPLAETKHPVASVASLDDAKNAAAVGASDLGVAASISMPHMEDGAWRGGFYGHQTTPRNWLNEDISLVEEVASQTWDAVRRADARAKLKRLNEQLEERVAQQTRDIRLITDALPVLIAFVDRSYTYKFANRAYEDWFYLKPEEVIGRTILDLTGPEQFELRREHFAKVLAGDPAQFELPWPRRDGSCRIADIRYLPRHNADAIVDGFYIFVLDITERVEAADRLRAMNNRLEDQVQQQKRLGEELRHRTLDAEAANRAKSSFLANMSHELRTPLSAVIGYTELLEEDANDSGNGEVLPDLAKIKTNAKHLLGLINDVLDLSKVEANKMELVPEQIDIAAFARDAAGTVDALAGRKSNTLRIEVADDLGGMVTDAVKLRQCLFNLLSNAAKFTENGTITLSAKREQVGETDEVAFTVRDDGIGMTPEQVARLFQRFTQADDTTTRKFGGTGLGLALSRAFAQLMGGDIAVESVEGQGTTFTIRVPAALRVQAPEETVKNGSTEESKIEGHGDLVLVIDDEASQRELMSRFLQRQGFAVCAAADGQSGIDLARSSKPKVILLDVMMPGMDGWAVLKALKGDPATAATPVVMVSFVADANIGASLGALDSMSKPVDWSRLKGVLGGLCREEGGDVLVVDDDQDMRQRLRTVLEKSGWTVREAGNGIEALERVGEMTPHLVLLDLTMPVMDGFTFLHRLKLLPSGADIPVVVLSARDISSVEREQLSAADSIMKKGDVTLREVSEEVVNLSAISAPAPRSMPGLDVA